MKNLKYKILCIVHDALPTNPTRRSHFYQNPKQINKYKKAIDELIDAKFLAQDVGSDKLSITKPGIAALEAETDRREDLRKTSVRYWITTSIAILALAISIIALLSQLGILQLPQCLPPA